MDCRWKRALTDQGRALRHVAGLTHGVLIGSSAIGTGVDGLQRVCNRLIVNVLPWTAAEFEQLKGRIYCQGQGQSAVTMILPLTYAEVHGQRGFRPFAVLAVPNAGN